MKKLIVSLFVLTVPVVSWCANSSLTVSSGTFLAIDGFLPPNSQFRQAIVVADPNTTANTTIVDSSGNLHVLISTYAPTSVNSQQVGSYTETPGTGTWSTNIINSTVGVVGTIGATQSGVWNLTNTTVGVVGTFWQATQPVSVATPYQVFLSSFGVNASTSVVAPMAGAVFPVSQSGNWNLQNSTVGVTGTVGATQSGTWNLNGTTVGVVSAGAFNLTNTTVGVTGSLTATTSFPSTATVTGTTPNAVDMIGAVGVSGTATQFRVDSSSSLFVSTSGVTEVGPWNLTGTTVGVVSAGAFNLTNTTVGVTGTINTAVTFLSTAIVSGTTPTVVDMIGGVGVSGTATQFRLDASSSVFVATHAVTTLGTVAVTPSSGTYPVSATFGLPVTSTYTSEGSWINGIPVTSTFTSEGIWTQGVPVTSTQTLSTGSTMYVLNTSSFSVAVGYQVGGASVPVSVLNTVTVNQHAVNEGNWIFGVPVTSTFTSEGIWTTAIPVTSTFTMVVSTFGDNVAVAANDRQSNVSGIYHKAYFDSNTAATAGRNAAESIGTDGTLFTSVWPAISTATYFASTNTFTIFNSTQDSTWLTGPKNANMMNVLMYLGVSCQQTTAGLVDIAILKRSTGYTGAFSTMTATPADSNYGITQSTANFSTAAGLTNGTLVGHIDNQIMGCNSSTGLNNDGYMLPSQLRGTIIVRSGEIVAVNFLNQSMAGAKLAATWIFKEVAAIKP